MQIHVFDIYFSTLVGMSYHPGNRRDEKFLTTQECADIAIEMIAIRQKLLGEKPCLSSSAD